MATSPQRTSSDGPTELVDAQTARRGGLHPRHNEPGSSPGTLFRNPEAAPTRVCWMRYGPGHFSSGELAGMAEVAGVASDLGDTVLWLDVRGLQDAALLEKVARTFEIHPLALADVVNVPQRPKCEPYEQHTLFIAQMTREVDDVLHVEQVALVLGRHFVLTFQERDEDGDVFEPVRQRIATSRGKIRQTGADYLAYALIDSIVDGYFPVLESLGTRLEELEERVLERPVAATSRKIHDLKRQLLVLRKAIWPLRDALAALVRGEGELMSSPTLVYLRDAHDHAVQVADMVETYREFAASLMDVYLSAVNNRMNEVVKVLTIISTIFLPLSFIAGVYGMNFDTSRPANMPELGWEYGYVTVWGVMIAVAVGMLLAFRRFGWLGGRRAESPKVF